MHTDLENLENLELSGNFDKLKKVREFQGVGEARTKKSVVLQQIFIQKARSQKQKVGGGKKYTFSGSSLQDLFKN